MLPTSTLSRRLVRAPRQRVYRALTSATAIAQWMVPDGMTSVVHAFEPREGGFFRISLTYASADGVGKTSGRTDTYHGNFVELVSDTRVVQRMAFETDDPAMKGEMRVTFELSDTIEGTDIKARHDNLPPGISEADNDLGWQMSLNKLAALVEGEEQAQS